MKSMARRFLGLSLLWLPWFAVVHVDLAQDTGPQLLYISVSGLRVEQNGNEFWVTFSNKQHAKLPVTLPDDPALVGNLPHEFHASPNEQWIWAAHHIGSCMRGSELFHRAGPDKIDNVKEFNDRAWDAAVKLDLFAKNFSRESACNMVEFGAWSGDSARLLLKLRGGEDKREMKERRIYFDVRTQKVELTNYMRKLNASKAEILACAEPVAPLPDESVLKSEYGELDRRLNARFAEVIAVAKEREPFLRGAQNQWLEHRDAGERIYVALFPATEKARRRLQFLCDVTAARIDAPNEQWATD